MKILKQNTQKKAISLILLDWNCRESYHIFEYLKQQRFDDFEVIWIEYYNKIAPIEVDTHIVLDIDKSYYYHKHLMYNVGIFYAMGDIVVIMDSDVMLKPNFTQSIYTEFEKNEDIILHLDEFRNVNQKHYPFDFLTFEEFMQDGCINCVENVTKGLYYRYDPIHNLNYGACFCAKKDDLISIGGADEHIDYLGHICGPYEMTFRLENYGKTVKWHTKEFLYHTWHPGSDGIGNYMGPHDGKNFSLKALEFLDNQRVYPYASNKAINSFDKDLLLNNISKKWSISYLG